MDTLRLSDAEREEAIARLGEHYAAGRLDKDEYDERSDAVWSARTRGDLRPVFADLEAPAPAYSAAAGQALDHRTGRPRLPRPVLLLLGVLLVMSVVTHLPFILLGLFVWCLLRFSPRYHHRRRW
jgi:uncharacterized membrane protein